MVKKPIKLLNPLACLVVVFLLAGCVPWPHTTDRSDEVHGRVLDAQTRNPIQGAKISFMESPHQTVYTDAAGRFHRKAIRNFHWAYLSPEGNWPNGKISATTITHPHYLPASGDWGGDAGDILLKPEM